MFHGVIREQNFRVRNHNKKHILETEFIDLVSALGDHGQPISINDLVLGNKIPPKSFIITFDDGFENNFSIARPILQKHKIPAIFYLTTGFIDENKMSWIDQIDYAVENTKKKQIKFNGRSIRISDDHEKIKFWTELEIMRKKKHFFLKKDKHVVKIFEQLNVSYCESSDSSIDLKMNWDQVRDLIEDPLFTIGGHTHSHPIMSYLSDFELEKEINTCLEKLEFITKKPVIHFSYPEGVDFCYNKKVIRELKKRGIRCCPTAITGTNHLAEDLFELKRITVL